MSTQETSSASPQVGLFDLGPFTLTALQRLFFDTGKKQLLLGHFAQSAVQWRRPSLLATRALCLDLKKMDAFQSRPSLNVHNKFTTCVSFKKPENTVTTVTPQPPPPPPDIQDGTYVPPQQSNRMKIILDDYHLLQGGISLTA